MLSMPIRFSRLRLVVSAITALAVGGGGFLVGLGIVRLSTPQGVWLIVAGASAALLFATAMAFLLLQLKVESNTARQYSELRDMQESLATQSAKLEEIAESVRISDAAKHITHREEEHTALRTAIYDEVRREEWEAAFHLIEQMRTRFGYHEEAQQLCEEVVSLRTDAMRTKMAQASSHIESLFAQHDWNQAEREIERLHKALPDERRIDRLANELRQRRQQRKDELLKQWNEALRRNDLDGGINVLKELDDHLTREEARKLEDSARGLFKEKLAQLGVQFKFAVSEGRWLDALEVGVQITEEFPNTRMSKEVQEHLVALRQRAGLPMSVEVTAAPQPGAVHTPAQE
ncbi:MAG: hypothetical protein GY842_15785 [bacterium]|nr:hypothetical protein [bacterium]